jgi:uncharacterized MAPEG superfamily protein
MTPELTVLVLAALLQALQYAAYAVAANRQIGVDRALGPRDEPIQLTGTAGRLQRALNNHFEGLILFTIACLVVTLSGQSSALTATLAWVYYGARILFIPAYVFGWVPWRSVIWAVGFFATLAMLLSVLF